MATLKTIPSWTAAPIEALKQIHGVCFDIDDTLSTHGKLTGEAYQALWDLKKAGFVLVPITGRPAGWCDHIARFWPVDAVVGENGAFVFYMEKGKRARIDTESTSQEMRQSKLSEFWKKIQKQFPEAKLASDQAYREYDLAIDFCEDVKPWLKSRVSELQTFCEQQGAHAKISSIHVNTWFGEFDKKQGFQGWISKGAPGLVSVKFDVKDLKNWIFIGDSPNDEPLFQYFKNSVGVANLKNFLGDFKSHPTWITDHESGLGFCELSQRLVESRS